MKLRDISARTAGIGEIAGIAGLYLSRQVEKPVLMLPLLSLAAYFFFGLRLANRWLLLLVALTAAGSVSAGLMGTSENTVLLTRALLATHALLWCAARPDDYRFYRLGLAFLEVVLASILAPETYMLGLIFAFAVLSSLALAFGFIERNYARFEPRALHEPVRGAFLASLAGVAVLVFLSSLLIFPILPRSQWEGRSLTETGYTELVSFRSATLGWAGDNSRPVLWVFRPDNTSWREAIPAGLLRAKVLETFDGTDWRPAVKYRGSQAPGTGKELFALEFFREPLATEVLPVPYGAAYVEAGDGARDRYGSGEFLWAGRQTKRVEYRVSVKDGYGLPADFPRAVHTRRPPAARFPRLRGLAAELAKGASTEAQKIRRVTEYLASNYRAQQVAVSAASATMHPVEQFLFETKEGHCELFSTAAALLLREMGIPTRLVAGFRVGLPEDAKVLTVRSAHAHAWLEVFTREKGWMPLDPTPRVLNTDSLPAFLTDSYDKLNAYWHRYILGYELDGAEAVSRAKAALPHLVAAAGAALMILLALGLRRALRAWLPPREPRERVGRSFARAGRRPTIATPEWIFLEARYEELRFGPVKPTRAMVKDFEKAVKAARRSGA